MPWVDLQRDVLEEFAGFAERAHRTEWEAWSSIEDRKRRSVESEVLGLKQLDSQLKSELLSAEALRNLSTDALRERLDTFSMTKRELAEQRRKEKARKVVSNAKASRSWYVKTVSDPERYPQHLAKKRQRRFDRRHEGQESFIDEH